MIRFACGRSVRPRQPIGIWKSGGHLSEPCGVVDVEASVGSIWSAFLRGGMAKTALAAARAALMEADREMDEWRCVLLLPLFSGSARQAVVSGARCCV